jgi:sugar phosphate isomerase/epimerase
MRLGAPIFDEYTGPEEWVAAVQRQGFRAAYCPVGNDQPQDVIRAYERAAADADIVIAEVGAWSNPMSPDPGAAAQALAHCQAQLALADEIGARCCVNIAGSRGEKWDGPDAADLTDDTFDMIVESVRKIIDAVQPKRTYYTLETMPWMYPDSADSYLALIDAVGRERFAAHFDPVNLINSPERYFHNAALLHECFDKLGPYMQSCHAKDALMSQDFLVHISEVRPGVGTFDYRVLLAGLARLDPDLPVMLEHLPAEEYPAAVAYVRSVAAEIGVKV